jgi:hypothetical protein
MSCSMQASSGIDDLDAVLGYGILRNLLTRTVGSASRPGCR